MEQETVLKMIGEIPPDFYILMFPLPSEQTNISIPEIQYIWC